MSLRIWQNKPLASYHPDKPMKHKLATPPSPFEK